MKPLKFSTPVFGLDTETIKLIVDQGIDARLEGFTKSSFVVNNDRLYCKVHPDEIQVLIRRLIELGDEIWDAHEQGEHVSELSLSLGTNAEEMADMFVEHLYGVEARA